jgi:hypothetical protein
MYPVSMVCNIPQMKTMAKNITPQRFMRQIAIKGIMIIKLIAVYNSRLRRPCNKIIAVLNSESNNIKYALNRLSTISRKQKAVIKNERFVAGM